MGRRKAAGSGLCAEGRVGVCMKKEGKLQGDCMCWLCSSLGFLLHCTQEQEIELQAWSLHELLCHLKMLHDPS